MAMNGFTKDMNIIQKLNDEPNDRDGLTAGELKAKFDEGGLAVKDYLNNTVKPHVDGMEEAADTHAADKANPHEVTKTQVGLGNVPNVSTNNQTPTYTEAASLTRLTSGEKLGTALGKLAKAVSSLISHIGDANIHFTAAERTKLSGIATGAEVNQNAFSNVKVGSATVAADGKTDTLELTAGNNITLTADAANDRVTIAAKDTTYSSKAAASGGTAVSLVTTGEKYNWNSKANGSHTHSAGDITSGTFAPARLPAATASAQGAVKLGAAGGAAAYSHTHSAGDITSGTFAPARLPAATASAQGAVKLGAAGGAAAYSHTHTSDAVTDLVTATQYGPTGLVSFNGREGLPLKSWQVDIEPVQEGSGDPSPSNIRSISGWTGAKVSHSGKNLMEITAKSITTNGVTITISDTGVITCNGTATSRIVLNISRLFSDFLVPGVQYHVTDTARTSNVSKAFVQIQTSAGGGVANINYDYSFVYGTAMAGYHIVVRIEPGVTVSNQVLAPMIYAASAADYVFEPFKGEVFDVSFPSEAGTVYGGTLDVLKGTLTVTHLGVILNGTQTMAGLTNGRWMIAVDNYKAPATNVKDSLFCDMLKPSAYNDLSGSDFVVSAGRAGASEIGIRLDSSHIGSAAVTAWLSANTPFVVYPAASPITYQLTPELVAALAGQNNFWADCGDVTVEYGAFLAAAEGAAEAGRTYTDLHYVTAGQKEGTTLGTGSTAEGHETTASGEYSHAEGNGTIASGYSAHAEGVTGTASGYFSHTEGYETTASGWGCHAEGHNTIANASNQRNLSNPTAPYGSSHAEGFKTTASGEASHAEGFQTKATGLDSHAEGADTTASGVASHAEGMRTIASGNGGSHAEGVETTASGVASHAEGEGTIAYSYQHVFGKYNVAITDQEGEIAEIVGWGTSDTKRKSIRIMDIYGNMTIAGTLTQSSDARLKDVQGEIPDVSGIRAVRFKWNDTNGEHDDRDHIGYIAQEVEKIAPYLVGDDSNGYKSLDYIALLCAKVEWLERRVAELEGGD